MCIQSIRAIQSLTHTHTWEVQPIADRVAQNLEIISETFPTYPTSAHGIYDLYHLINGTSDKPLENPGTRLKVFRKNLKILCHPICNWLYVHTVHGTNTRPIALVLSLTRTHTHTHHFPEVRPHGNSVDFEIATQKCVCVEESVYVDFMARIPALSHIHTLTHTHIDNDSLRHIHTDLETATQSVCVCERVYTRISWRKQPPSLSLSLTHTHTHP